MPETTHLTPEETAAWPRLVAWVLRPRAFWAVFALMALLRLWTITSLNLVQDEAYYWVWSRHLSWSYFDHPPMVAWLIRASTSLLGHSEFAVRLPGAVVSLASIPVIMWGVRGVASPMAARLAGLIVLLTPPAALAGSIITPDAPVWFFGTAAIAAGWRASGGSSSSAGMWLLFGASLGLAMLSKYTAALIGPCVFLALLSCKSGREHLKRPWLWTAVLVSVVLFAPVVLWNANHEWASFRFQLGHGFDATGVPALKGVGDLLGGLILAWTPVLFVITVVAALVHTQRVRRLDSPGRITLALVVIPLCLFFFSATRRRVEINWPLLVAAPAAALTAVYVAEGTRVIRRAAGLGLVIAALMTISVQVPPLVLAFAPRVRHFGQLFGYRELALEVTRLAQHRPVLANRYQDAAELMYYMPGRPAVWPLNIQSRPNAFDYFTGNRGLGDVAVLVNVPESGLPSEYRVVSRTPWPTLVKGKLIRTDIILVVERGN